MAYVPNPTDASQPIDSVFASTAAAEFRALKAYVQSIVSAGVIGVATPGQIVYFPGGAPPAGWLECDGTLKSRTTFANLWTALNALGAVVSEAVWAANNFGLASVGDGSTTFRIPDLRGVFIRNWNHGKAGGYYDAGRGEGDVQFGTKHYDNCGNLGAVIVLPITSQASENPDAADSLSARSYNTVTPGATGSAALSAFISRPTNITLMPCIRT